MNMLRPISRKYDRAEHEYPKELDMLAAMIDGLVRVRARPGRRRRRRTRDEDATTTTAGVRNGTNLASVLSIAEMCWGDTGAAARDAAPGPRQLRHRLGRQRRAARAASPARGRRWRSPSPSIGSDSASIRTTAATRRRRVRPQRREDLRHLRRARRQRRRLGDARQVPGPGGDQVVRGREGHPGHEGRAARAQARHPRLRHRGDHASPTAGCRRRTSSARRRSTSSRASPARWRPSTTPGRWSPRWPWAAPGPRST